MSGPRPRLLVPIALMAAIAAASHRPLAVDLPNQSDKLVHGVAFGTLALAWTWALAPAGPLSGRAAGLALAVAGGWGVLDEVHQSFVPGRTAALGDAFADVCGAALAVAGVAAWRARRAASSRAPSPHAPSPHVPSLPSSPRASSPRVSSPRVSSPRVSSPDASSPRAPKP